MRQIVTNGGDSKKTTTVYFSPTFAPHVLRRETTVQRADDSQPIATSSVEVLAVGMPYKVLSETKTVSLIKTVNRHQDGSTVTVEVYTPDVPGGIVANTTREMNGAGRVIRRSTLELVDYGLDDDEGEPIRKRLLDRIRSNRGRR
jgi:hypothetical protein